MQPKSIANVGRARKNPGRFKRTITLAVAAAAIPVYERMMTVCADASNVTLTDGDKAGTTSFSGTSNHWSASGNATLPAGSAPDGNYTYEVLGGNASASLLRTPTSGSFVFGGASLQLDDGAGFLIKTSGTITVGTLILSGGVVELDNVGAMTLAGNITLNPGATSAFNSDIGQSLTVTSAISGSGNISIDGADAQYGTNTTFQSTHGYRADNPPTSNAVTGVVTFAGSNSYTGVTTLTAGTLSLGNTSALAGGGNITFAGGALQFTGNNTNDYSARIVNSTGPMLIDTNGGNVTFAANLSATNQGGLTKTGNGTLFLTNGQTGGQYLGGLTINAGTVNINGNSGLGAASQTVGNVTTNYGITFTGNGTLQLASSLGFNLFVNTRTISIPTAGVTGVIDTNNNNQGIVTAPQRITGNGAFAKAGLGTLVISGNNTYAGGTVVSAGILRADNTSGSATGTGNVTVAASTTSGNYTGGMLGGNGAISGSVTLLGSAGARLGGIIGAGADSATVGTFTTGNETWSGGAAYQWKINTAGTANTPDNVTTLSSAAGSSSDLLMISPAVNSASPLLTITGNTTSPFTIAPGGNLTGNITLGSSNTYNWELAQIGAGNATQISINGTLFGGNSTTNLLTATNAFALDTSALNVGSSNGSFLSASNFSLYFEMISSSNTNDLVLSYNAAPEPGTGLLVLCGGLPLLARGRRKNRRPPVREGDGPTERKIEALSLRRSSYTYT